MLYFSPASICANPPPACPPALLQVFDQHMRGPNQIQSKPRQEFRTTQEELLKVCARWYLLLTDLVAVVLMVVVGCWGL